MAMRESTVGNPVRVGIRPGIDLMSRAAGQVKPDGTVAAPFDKYHDLNSHLTIREGSSKSGETLAALVREVQARRKLSYRDLGDLTGFEKTTLLRITRGDRDPRLSTAVSMVRSFALTDEQVYGLVMSAVPEELTASEGPRMVYDDSAPALDGAFGEQLKEYRRARHLTMRGLAAKSGVDHSRILKIEKIEGDHYLSKFAAIIYGLGLNTRQVRNLINAFGQSAPKPVNNPTIIEEANARLVARTTAIKRATADLAKRTDEMFPAALPTGPLVTPQAIHRPKPHPGYINPAEGE